LNVNVNKEKFVAVGVCLRDAIGVKKERGSRMEKVRVEDKGRSRGRAWCHGQWGVGRGRDVIEGEGEGGRE
jgi:hypothetical protein